MTKHATPETKCAQCGAPQEDGLIREGHRWLCPSCLPPLPKATCGCTRKDAYSHFPDTGFRCKHGKKV